MNLGFLAHNMDIVTFWLHYLRFFKGVKSRDWKDQDYHGTGIVIGA